MNWQPTSVLLHREDHGQRSFVGVHGGGKESETTE